MLKLFPLDPSLLGRGLAEHLCFCMCVCAGGWKGGGAVKKKEKKKRGPALLEVVTSLCVCSIHPWIKAPRVRECACV